MPTNMYLQVFLEFYQHGCSFVSCVSWMRALHELPLVTVMMLLQVRATHATLWPTLSED